VKPQALLAWSSGKDSAWALHQLRHQNEVEIVGLLTTFNEAAGRVAMHGVRRELVKAQADAVGLPLWEVPLPWPCTNQQYEQRMQQVLQKARHEGISHMAFGDLFLSEIRSYREQQLAGTGITPLFPLWTTRELTLKLAQEMIQSGLKAILTCVDPKRLTPSFAGREFDHDLLSELPKGVDPCGENGEFHTFCYAGPMFSRTIPITHGEIVEREGFVFADWLPAS
jgi:uncharacterized protein (TIGR00290 family)